MAPETPRGVSSRLLTMKFMQRAANSASSTGSPGSDVPSSKKRKVGHSPSEGRMSMNIDQATIKAALDDQETKRLAALEKHVVGADTHWVLKDALTGSKAAPAKPSLNVVYIGYGEIDSSDEESGDKAKPQKDQDDTSNSDGSSDGDSDSSEESSPDRKQVHPNGSPHTKSDTSRSRSRSQPRNNKEITKAKEFREKRKKKEVKLNKLTSISSAGGDQFGSSSNSKPMQCYKCQQAGHKAVDCPSGGNSRGRSNR
ncbi:hypothetical protein G7046_g301 [Stylonectria norvegica]|nr:hypothetical protein G7046_g301 [Stylonectria norvegica]